MKAILVIDMPEVCGVCPLCQPDNERNMCYCGKTMTDIKLAEKPDRCPLKPMPKEEDIYEVGMDEEDTNAKRQWNKGWNACLDKIMGETE